MMNVRHVTLGLCMALVSPGLWSCCTTLESPVRDPDRVVLPYEWFGDIGRSGPGEPSGIVFDPVRGTLFVIGDEGEICEMSTDGTVARHAMLRKGADLEGLARVPQTGMLYVAIEGEEKILEVDPQTFAIAREFTIPRNAGEIELFKPGGQGIEGICFVPDDGHPQGGIFLVANQSFTLEPGEEKSVIVEVELPLRDRQETGPVRIGRWFEPGVIDISTLHYDAASGHILAVSDAANILMEFSPDGDLFQVLAFTGDNQEGLAMDDEGLMYVAQDSGGIIKFRPLWPPWRR